MSTLQVNAALISQANTATQIADVGTALAASSTLELINTASTEAEVTVYISTGTAAQLTNDKIVAYKIKLNPNGGSYLRNCALMGANEKVYVTSSVAGVVARFTALKETA